MAVINGDPTLNNTLYGTPDADTINGAQLNDALYGQGGDDTLNGKAGNDFLNGGHGNDQLYGGDHNDTILGGQGNDDIYGGAGRDYLTGGQGCDTFHFDRTDYPGTVHNNADLVTDFTCYDKAVFDGFTNVTWDSAKASFFSGAGHEIAHLNGLEGHDMALTHTGSHWDAVLA
jgi:Ca2+-binding RTX toxin-like protein